MKHLFTTLICCFTIGVCAAQDSTATAPTLSVDSTTTIQTTLPDTIATIPAIVDKEVFRKNGVKMNLTSLAFSNYSFSYERALARKITLVGGYSFAPETKASSIPLVKKGLEFAELESDEDGEEISDILDEANVKSNAITGELRFYTGKKAGARGFYASIYGRYTTMQLSHLYEYENDLGVTYDLPLNAKLTGVGGGVMFGAQWLIAKRVTFDWYIIGGHYGKLSGNIDAKTDLRDMSEEDKAELEAELEDMATHGDRKYIDATVNDNGMFGKVNSPFAGIRGLGFNLGIAF
ncbi:DUF3575 domain-containing protein [Pontibacter sp. H259]|uniref:DUF3575 domain-containing protein n=1 Tax=Pontibacter sp. H259 TaxID=3133421 RepID=UPI0030C55E08